MLKIAKLTFGIIIAFGISHAEAAAPGDTLKISNELEAVDYKLQNDASLKEATTFKTRKEAEAYNKKPRGWVFCIPVGAPKQWMKEQPIELSALREVQDDEKETTIRFNREEKAWEILHKFIITPLGCVAGQERPAFFFRVIIFDQVLQAEKTTQIAHMD